MIRWFFYILNLKYLIMKKLLFTLPLISLFLMFSCNKEELDTIGNDVEILQDSLSLIVSQHNAMLDSISEIINTLNDNSVDIKSMKLQQLPELFDGIARQPEVGEILISATEILYSDYTELLPLSDENVPERGYTIGYDIGYLIYSICRQPEAFDLLDSAATKFIGPYSPDHINDEMLEYMKISVSAMLSESIARNPEYDSLYNVVTNKYLNYNFINED